MVSNDFKITIKNKNLIRQKNLILFEQIGFIMYWVGCSQIYTMAAISLERFIIIFKPLSLKSITFKMSYIVMAICTFLGGFMASAPLFGWSYYSLEGSLTSCSVEWAERSTNVISYNIFIFCVTFCIPVCIIIPSNLKLLFIVSHFFFGMLIINST